MKTQIPIYRAKKIGSDEWVEGFLIPHNPDMQDGIVTFEKAPMEMDTGHVDVYTVTHKIDYSTLSIHMPDMLDSEGTKIFASLSEDGKGGDILEYATVRMGVARYFNYQIMCSNATFDILKAIARSVKATGIQE